MNKKYLKVLLGNTASSSFFQYKMDEVMVAPNWNPTASNPKEMGGFNFSTEDKILRWLVRGDTVCDVLLLEDAEVIECESASAPHGVFRSNKIVLSNPRPVTDDLAMFFYLKSDLPEISYYKALAGLAIRGHIHTCEKLIEDRVHKENIDLVLREINDFIKPENETTEGSRETLDMVMEILKKIKNSK